MSEVTDLVMPVLQKIKVALADLKREVVGVREILVGQGEKLEIYMAYETGLGAQSKASVRGICKKISAMTRRVHDTRP